MTRTSLTAAGLGFSNGRIPISFMTPIGNGQYLEAHAAVQLRAALADMAAHGFSVPIVEGYRSYDEQVRLRDLYLSGRGNVAAVPGTSNHGDGRAVDLGWPMDSWTSAAQAYWQTIEATYGYSSAQGRADGEAWHKVCTVWLGELTTTITTEEEDDMSAADVAAINAHTTAEINRLAEYVRREARLRLYQNTATGQYMAASIRTGRYEILSGQSEVDSLVQNGYLEIAAGDAAAPQKVDQTRWDNIIAKCPVNIKAIA